MKKIIFSIIICLLGLSFSACHDLLNEPPENTLIQEEIDYTIKEDLIKPIHGLYGRIYNVQGFGNYPIMSVRGDDVNAGGLGDQPELAEMDKYRYYRVWWMSNDAWNVIYQRILDALNTEGELQAYKDGGADAKAADCYIAETKVIRAFFLYYLSQLWGDILIPTTGDPTDLFVVPLSSQEEVMQHISDLMDEAIPALPDMHPKNRSDIPGGVTKGMAYAMKARANQMLKNYQKVAEATSEIIKSGHFALEPDFYEMFYTKLSKESLFEYQYSVFGTNTGTQLNCPFNDFFGPQKISATEGWRPKATAVNGGWGFFEPSLKYIKFMIDRKETVRLETTVWFSPRGIAEIRKDPKYVNLPDWISNETRSGDVLLDFPRALFSAGKFIQPSDRNHTGRNGISAGKNFICIRYAEILLMHAEALVQGGTGSSITALQAVNQVRSRAKMPDVTAVNMDVVADEKFAELATEWGHRFYDCIRWGKLNELSYDGKTFSKELTFLYYPQEQVDLLPVLRGVR